MFQYIAYITYKNICYPYFSITLPPPILFLYTTGDTQYITRNITLREEMVAGFINSLSCHLQRLEWRIEAIFELTRVEKQWCQWWRKDSGETTLCGQWSWNEWSSQTLYRGPNISTLGRRPSKRVRQECWSTHTTADFLKLKIIQVQNTSSTDVAKGQKLIHFFPALIFINKNSLPTV